jgi:hypothetical protein
MSLKPSKTGISRPRKPAREYPITREVAPPPPDACAHERTEYWLGNTYCVLCRKWLHAGPEAPASLQMKACGSNINLVNRMPGLPRIVGSDETDSR